ncbi:hypothetical protein B5X24_HaOG203960 [Helicoverpa armigera]|uniref:FLYWCH-type domain-containing protein n=1 Tax=Helicoverpa armigera TaxID=29058 RepID=A0A2W1BPN0_HELAM|nr:hypothetical protein B5X24_HaOG203960 [Helicoverpa armigera]
MLSGYKFYRHRCRGLKTRWFCSSDRAIFTKSSKGADVILLSGYKFLKHRMIGPRIRWFCGTHRKKGCGAVLYTHLGDILKINNEHDHAPPFLNLKMYVPVFTTSRRGAPAISVYGHIFHKHRTSGAKTRWWCQRVTHGCTAVIFTIDDEIVKTSNEHNHPPPNRR